MAGGAHAWQTHYAKRSAAVVEASRLGRKEESEADGFVADLDRRAGLGCS